MPTTSACPACGRRLLVPDDLWGRSVRCPGCQTVFVPADHAAGEVLPDQAPPEAPAEQVRAGLPAGERYRKARAAVPPALPDEGEYGPGGPLPGGAVGVAAMLLLAVAGMQELVSVGPKLAYIFLLAGDRVVGGDNDEMIDLVESVNGLMALAGLLLLLVTGVVFCIWFYRAHKNLTLLGVRGLTYSPGWAAGSFFVPILNLFRPYQIAQEVWRASDPAAPPDSPRSWRAGSGSALIGGWWACWILANLTGTVASRMEGFGTATDPGTLQAATLVDLVSSLLSFLAAVLAILVIKQIRARQVAKYEQPAQSPG